MTVSGRLEILVILSSQYHKRWSDICVEYIDNSSRVMLCVCVQVLLYVHVQIVHLRIETRGQHVVSSSAVFHLSVPTKVVLHVCVYPCGLHSMLYMWISRTIFRTQVFSFQPLSCCSQNEATRLHVQVPFTVEPSQLTSGLVLTAASLAELAGQQHPGTPLSAFSALITGRHCCTQLLKVGTGDQTHVLTLAWQSGYPTDLCPQLLAY